MKTAAQLRAAPGTAADIIATVEAGDRFEMLDDSCGWAWGYAGAERLVGYLPSESLRG